VLVADDNRDSAETLALLLELRGFDVTTAHDGEAAVCTFAQWHPDVVLLDLGMPKLSGHDACRAIRAMPHGDQPLIIAVTGWGQARDRERSQAAGFDVHLVKPVDHDTLSRLLNQRGMATPSHEHPA
jgi:CheY-like chemotaxis protein